VAQVGGLSGLVKRNCHLRTSGGFSNLKQLVILAAKQALTYISLEKQLASLVLMLRNSANILIISFI
jgi:hypothetical protein